MLLLSEKYFLGIMLSASQGSEPKQDFSVASLPRNDNTSTYCVCHFDPFGRTHGGLLEKSFFSAFRTAA